MTREETINFLRKKIEKNPKSILFARLADYYLKQKRIKEALELCTKGCEYNPDYITGNYILAKIYLTMGEHEKAETQFKKVISHDRYFLAAHKHLGDMMAKIGWENKAINHYKDILKLDPMEQEASQMLETFSLEEDSDDTEIFYNDFSASEDTNVLDESSQDDDIKTTEIDQELRKVFDEENVSEETTKQDIELEEVTAEDKSATEEEKDTETEDLKFELPDDLNEKETEKDQISSETTDEKDKSDETPKAVSEDDKSDSWILPGDMEEEIKTEEKETKNLENLHISKPSEPESKDIQSADEDEPRTEADLDQEINKKEMDSFTETSENTEETEEEKVTDTERESDEYEITPPETHDTDEDLREKEIITESEPAEYKKTLPEKQETEEIPEKEIITDPESEKQEDQPPEKQDAEKDIQDASSQSVEQKKEIESADKEDNLVTPTLGEIYSAQGQYSKALDVYKKLLEKNPDNKEYKKKIQELEQKQ